MENDLFDTINMDDLTEIQTPAHGGLAEGGGEPQQLTPEEENTKLKAQIERYKSLDFLADALEKDPSKIHDLRATAEGKIVDRSLTEHTTPAAPVNTGPKSVLEAIRMLPKEKQDELNALAAEKPAEYQAALADLSAQIHLTQFATASQPIVDATVHTAIEQFKSAKSTDPIYRHALPYFDREMKDFDRATFYQMAEAQRTRQMELRWSSAKAAAYDAAAAKRQQTNPRTLGGGGGGNGGGSLKTTPDAPSDAIAELAARSGLKPGQLEKIQKEIEV